MYKKNITKLLIIIIFVLLPLLLSLNGSKDLVGSFGIIPGLIDSPDKGVFIDLIKAMDEVYTEGNFIIEVYPMARAINNIVNGKADFFIPSLRNPDVPADKLPFRYASEKIGTVAFVLYTNKEKPITKKMIDEALAKGEKFPYSIEGPFAELVSFPIGISNNIETSLKKAQTKRIDALLWAQEEVDAVIKQLKLKAIHRELYALYDDVLLIQKGTEGDQPDKILSNALLKLKNSGKLQQIYSAIHHQYDNWQPYKMGW